MNKNNSDNLSYQLLKRAETAENATRVARICASDDWVGIQWTLDRLEEYWKGKLFSIPATGLDDIEFARYVKDYKMKIEALAEIYSALSDMVQQAGNIQPVVIDNQEAEDGDEEPAGPTPKLGRTILGKSEQINAAIGDDTM